MGARRWHPQQCKHCGVTVEEVGHISATGQCLACGSERKAANLDQLYHHSGPWFDHWLGRCRAAFGIPAVDDPRSGA